MQKLTRCAGYLRRPSVVPFLEWLPVRVKVERRVPGSVDLPAPQGSVVL
jgi:hypothetical protein